jgi:hypothetical protein
MTHTPFPRRASSDAFWQVSWLLAHVDHLRSSQPQGQRRFPVWQRLILPVTVAGPRRIFTGFPFQPSKMGPPSSYLRLLSTVVKVASVASVACIDDCLKLYIWELRPSIVFLTGEVGAGTVNATVAIRFVGIMVDQTRFSAKAYREVTLPGFCPRCFWFKLLNNSSISRLTSEPLRALG